MTNHLKITRYKTTDKRPVTCTGCGEQRQAAGFSSYWVYPEPLFDGSISACRAADPLCETCLTTLLEAEQHDEPAPSAA